ncbi:MAG TPA: DUF4118 domain-containing protein [Polyangiaceae bacterium]
MKRIDVRSYLLALASAGTSTVVAWLLFGRSALADVVMIYLLGVVLVATRVGFGASIVAALSSVAAFDFIFVPPYLTLRVADFRHAVTFVVMFVVAVVTSGLTQRVRRQAVERAVLAEETERARHEVEAEKLRSSLLSSVSHDLRTPLAVITGAAGTLLEQPGVVPERARRELLGTILEEAERLNRLIRNLLDMTRLESGVIRPKKEWLPLDELVGGVVNRMEKRLVGRDVRVEVEADLPLVSCDAMLVEQALTNLLENALKYGADPLEVNARLADGAIVVEVLDRGPGIPEGELLRVFEKFHRASREGNPGGVGLGLAICRAVAAVHGGRIEVRNREGGGAAFRLFLPIEGAPP